MKRFSRAVLIGLLAVSGLAASADVRGVVMTRDGVPVAKARVSVYPLEPGKATRARWQSAAPQRVALATVETTSAGAFNVKVDAPVALLQVDAQGFAPAALRVAKDEEIGALALAFAPERKGTVRSGSAAVAGARVVWTAIGGAEIVAVTDAEGRYAVPDPEKWAQRVAVVHSEYAVESEAAVPPQTKIALDRKLSKGVAIDGKVTAADRKTPVAGAEIHVDGWKLGVSGEDGAFGVAHAPAKWQELRAVSGATSATVSTTKGAVALSLTKTPRLTGVVRDAQSKVALAGAEVAAVPAQGDFVARAFGRSGGITMITDTKGSFAIELPSGSYELQAIAPGYAFASVEVTLAAGGAVDRALPLTKLARVVGRVVDEENRPVAATWVTPSGDDVRSGRGGGPRMRVVQPARAMSGPDGKFVLRNAQVDSAFGLQAAKKGFPSGTAPSMTLASGETKTGIVITIPRGIEVTGLVTDAALTPVSGATVTAGSAERGGGGGRVMLRMMLGDNAGAEDVQTGSDGRFSMRLAEGKYDLSFRREGFAPYRASAIDVRPGVAPVEVALQPGAEIAGRVVRSGGGGIEGVSVSAMMGGVPTSATTGTDGAFVLEDLAPGAAMLIVRKAEEFIQVMRTVTAPASDVTIEVPKGESVSGRVVDKASGEAITGFSAGVSGEAGGGGMRIVMPPVLKSFRTDDGTFQLSGLPIGPVQLVVSAPGYVQQRVPGLVLEEGKPIRDLEVALETGTRISGRVTGPDGRPLASVSVAQQRQGATGPGAPGMGGDGTATDAEGNYQLEAVEPGEKSFVFARDGYPSTTKSVSVEGREMKLDVQLGRGATIAGVVVTESGSPVAGANVIAQSATSRPQVGHSDADGSFRIEGISDGRYSILAQKTGYVDAELEDVDAASAGSLRLVLGHGGRITGRVTGLQSSEYAQVRVVARSGTLDAGANPDSTGAYTIDGVPTGTVRVSATKGAGFAGSMQTTEAKTVELAAGGEAMVDLEFRSDRVVSGRVTRNRAPLEGATVRFNPKSPAVQTRGTATTDSSGNYEVRGLADGEYEVTVFDATRMTAHNETRQVGGSASVDVDILTATLRGRVTDSDTGSGIAGVRIQFEPKSSGSSGIITRRLAESDASGSFVVDDIVPGSYAARAEKDGYSQDVRDLEVSDNGADGVDFAIAKSDGVRFRVVDARTGTALGGQVRVSDALGRTAYEGSFPSSAEGTKISLARGSYRVSVFAEGYAPVTSGVTAPSAGTTLGLTPGGTIEIELDGSEARSGRLLDATGADYQRWFWMRQPSFRIDPGLTTLRNIAAGSYGVALLDEAGNVTKSWPVTVVEGGTARVRVSK